MSMRKIFWMLTLASTVLGGLYFAWTVIYAVNFTQLTAQTLVSLAIVIIPFVFTRCLEGMRHTDVLRVRIVGNERPGGVHDRVVCFRHRFRGGRDLCSRPCAFAAAVRSSASGWRRSSLDSAFRRRGPACSR